MQWSHGARKFIDGEPVKNFQRLVTLLAAVEALPRFPRTVSSAITDMVCEHERGCYTSMRRRVLAEHTVESI